jgi:chemotaxis protein methyltransferase CheR
MHHRFSFKELEEFSRFLNREYGLKFTSDKFRQLENRILPLMSEFKCRIPTDIISQSKKNIRLRTELLNALTTNETWFFRHEKHHDILRKKIIPELIARNQATGDNRIKFWSAGCSIGAELYSVLITFLQELPDLEKWNLTLVGSDISSDAIKHARKAKFEKDKLVKAPKETLKKYFFPCGNDFFQIKPELTRLVNFEILNLLENWPARKFDIIFCCNVMIYFENQKKEQLTEKFVRALNPNGYFFMGTNESIHWETEAHIKRLFIENEYIYQKSKGTRSYRLYDFATPSDLLRALNILNQCGLPYQLEKITPRNNTAPKRAIFLDSNDCNRAEELFSLSSIKISTEKSFVK